MVGNASVEQQRTVDGRDQHLRAQIDQLRQELTALSKLLEVERAHRTVLQRAVGFATARARALERSEGDDPETVVALDGSERPVRPGNVYVFDDEDESRAAFDEFFAAPDPHLEKVRGFLLD